MPKDACYYKVVSRYGPKTSAYRSGAMAKCRKVGAATVSYTHLTLPTKRIV